MANKSFSLRSLVAADIPECARLAGVAFESDRQTQLKALDPINPYNHEEGMAGALEHWLATPLGTVEGTVAFDDSTKEIIGWVAWAFRGFNSPEAEEKLKRELQDIENSGDALKQEEIEESTDSVEAYSSESTRDNLERYTSQDMTNWTKRLMPPGTKCMCIASIVVHPSHQGHGVGSALIRKGTDRADAEGVFCWVHASEAGAGMFAKHQFKEVGRLELDLDHWNRNRVLPPRGTSAKWGMYTFKYMRREAIMK